MLSVVSLRAGRLEDALASIDDAVKEARADGNDWEEGLALAVRAAIIARHGRLDEALDHFRQAVVLDPKNRTARARARAVLLRQGRGEC